MNNKVEKEFSSSENQVESPFDCMSGIGERIKEVRGSTPLSTYAKQLNVHKNTLRHYESENTYPDSVVIVRISQLGNVEPKWLLLGDGPKYLGDKSMDFASDINMELLQNCILAVDEVLKEKNRSFSAKLRSKIVAFLYDMELKQITEGQKRQVIDNDTIVRLINLAS